MTARKRKHPGRVDRSAPKSAAAKRSNKMKVSATAPSSATRLPVSLERRLVAIEGRLAAVEQLTICPLACSPSCAFRCPTEAVTE